MTDKEFKNLQIGDVVLGGSGLEYVIQQSYEDHYVGTRTVTITNQDEWELIKSREEIKVTMESEEIPDNPGISAGLPWSQNP